MSKLSSSVKLPIKCPKCGKVNKKAVAELKPDSVFACAGCGAEIRVSGDGFKRAGKALDELQKSITKIGRK